MKNIVGKKNDDIKQNHASVNMQFVPHDHDELNHQHPDVQDELYDLDHHHYVVYQKQLRRQM